MLDRVTNSDLPLQSVGDDSAAKSRGMVKPTPPSEVLFLAQMPPASGVALGFDRLVMLAAGARTINDVLWTPFPAA